jgi:ATP-dependent DNA helicase RecG
VTRDELEALREGWDFEAKLAAGRDGQGAVPLSFWETYSAMANTEGGVVVLGAREREDQTLELVGIADIDKVEADLWNTIQNPSKVSANLLRRQDVERVEVDSRGLLVIRVPKAARAQRPVHLNGSPDTKTFLRVHDGDRVATREVVRRMLADAQPERDAVVLDGYGEADLDANGVRQYRNVFASRRPDHPFLREDDAGFLRQIGVLKHDRVRNVDGLTLGGLLMLGREDAIRDRYPHWHLSYRERSAAPESSARWTDRIAADGTWNANVFEFYGRVIGKLHEGLKVPFALDAAQFRRDDTPAHAAIREALVNTLVHADYEGGSGIRIIREPAGYEFINPGLLLVATEQVWRGGLSEPRNPVLQRLFGLLNLGEREGSGGPAIRHAWEEQHWRPPALREDTEHAETHLLLSQVSLFPPAAVEELRRRLAGAFDAQDETGRIALVTAHAEGLVTHARLCELTGAHSRDVTLKLQDLVRKGLLLGAGGPRAKTYTLAFEPSASTEGQLALGLPASASEETASSFVGTSGAPRESSEETSPGSQESLGGAERGSTQSSASPTQSSTQTPASSTQSPGEHRVAGSSWAGREEVEAAILAIATPGFVTADELATRLNRSIRTLRQNYLNGMVAAGKLTLLHPDKPTSPLQAYRAARRNG